MSASGEMIDDSIQNIVDEIDPGADFEIYLSESNILNELKDISNKICDIKVTDVNKAKGSWAQTRLDIQAFLIYVDSLIESIRSCAESPNMALVNEDKIEKFKVIVDNINNTIKEFNSMTMPQLNPNTPQHFKHVITVFIQSFSPFLDIVRHLTGHSANYEKIIGYDDFLNNKLAVENKFNEIDNLLGDTSDVNAKLNLVRKKVRRLSEKSEQLDGKVTKINLANDSVDKLPKLIESLDVARADIKEIKELSDKDKFKSEQNIKESDELLIRIRDLNNEAEKLVNQCRNARQITITESLAAGFEIKEKQLKWSIRFWVLGLILGLAGGAFLAHERVTQIALILEKDLTAGQAILHLFITLFALGGPLWWAWLCTSQINKTFKLSEDYSYKASIAKAYTGFQDEAEKFDEKLSERLFTSTIDRFDEMPLRLINPKDHSSPWHEIISSKTFKKFLKPLSVSSNDVSSKQDKNE